MKEGFLEEEMAFEVRFAGWGGSRSEKSRLRILRTSTCEGGPGGKKEPQRAAVLNLLTSVLSSQTCY